MSRKAMTNSVHPGERMLLWKAIDVTFEVTSFTVGIFKSYNGFSVGSADNETEKNLRSISGAFFKFMLASLGTFLNRPKAAKAAYKAVAEAKRLIGHNHYEKC